MKMLYFKSFTLFLGIVLILNYKLDLFAVNNSNNKLDFYLKNMYVTVNQFLQGKEFHLHIAVRDTVTNKFLLKKRISNVYAIKSKNNDYLMFCWLANGLSSKNSFLIFDIEKLSFRPLQISRLPFDEVDCRIDASSTYFLIFDILLQKNNVTVFDSTGKQITTYTINNKHFREVDIKEKLYDFTNPITFGGALSR